MAWMVATVGLWFNNIVISDPLTLMSEVLFAAIVITLVSAWVARSFGWVDVPGGRKDHSGEVPLAGGTSPE